MKFAKRGIGIILAVTMIAGLTACGGNDSKSTSGGTQSAGNSSQQQSDEKYVLKLSSVLADSSPNAQGLYEFEKYVEEKSDGRIDVQIYTAGTLATSDEINVEMVMSGGTEMCVSPTYVMAGKSDIVEYWVTAYPYLSYYTDAYYEFMNNSDIMKGLNARWEEATNVKIMGCYDIGYNVLANKVRPLEHPGDGKGLKMRVAVSPIMLDSLQSFGPTGIAMAYAEVYAALQQGTVDGVQTSTPNLKSDLFYELCDYVTLTNHYLCMYAIYLNGDFYAKLPEDLQQVLTDGCNYLVETERELYANAEQETIEFMEGAGIEVIQLSIDELDEWNEAAQVAVEAHVDEIGRDFYAQCKEEMAKIEKELGH